MNRPLLRASAFCLTLLLVLAFTPAGSLASSPDGLSPGALPERPIPYPLTLPPMFERAIERGTRTTTGEPGPNYWTNEASYEIRATLSPGTRTLRGRQTITYRNNSPDDLQSLSVHLYNNLHKEGTIRNRAVEVTGGMHIGEVILDGQPLVENPTHGAAGYTINTTVMRIILPAWLESGDEIDLEITWSFTVPEDAPRMGVEDNEVFYLGYWYPQMAVYNDIEGWRAEPYQGSGEFYMGFADYDVQITVPQGWLVSATGELVNDEEVLSNRVRERLAQAAETREVVRIIHEDERDAGFSTQTSPTGTLTWHFQAENMRDFAFSASNQYIWDATSAEVGDRNGDSEVETTMIHALYRPGTASWERAAEFAQFSIEHLSEYFTPYPWPHMTAVEGVIAGGMEYPMITLIGGNRTDETLFNVTYHEIAHMWFPMIVGQDEKSYTWMDEGPVSFVTNEGRAAFFDEDAWAPARQNYYTIAGSGLEMPVMRHGDEYPVGTWARVIAGYSKPAVSLHALRGLVGQDRFQEVLREYIDRWAFKHPEPWDFFNTMNDVLEEDLDWFWRALFFETWTLDHAIASVEETDEAITVTIEDRGLVPMPVPVEVTYEDGTTAKQRVPVSEWLSGARTATLEFNPGRVVRVEIDPYQYLPDIHRHDSRWEAEEVVAH